MFLLLVGAADADERVVVFGDRWGGLSSWSLQKTFDARAPGNDVFNAAKAGERSEEMNTADPYHGLPYITSTLAAHPTADLVHLSIGGNDIRHYWTAAMSKAAEDALLTRITDDVAAVVSHISAQRPDIEVFYSSYDYLRSVPDLGTPLEVNTVLEELQSRVDSRLDGIPRATTHSFYGLMQMLFGQSEFGLPPGDSLLPDINLPGPPEAFIDDIHLTFGAEGGPFGYDLLAGEQYAVFYQSHMVPEPNSFAWLVLAGCIFLAIRSRRKRNSRVP